MKFVINLAALLFFGAVFLVAYTGRGGVYFAFLKNVPGGDKTGHVVLLLLMSLVFMWMLSWRYFRVWRVRVYHGMVVAFVLITAEEFLQLMSPYRNFDLFDLACNYLGIALAGIAVNVYESLQGGVRGHRF